MTQRIDSHHGNGFNVDDVDDDKNDDDDDKKQCCIRYSSTLFFVVQYHLALHLSLSFEMYQVNKIRNQIG